MHEAAINTEAALTEPRQLTLLCVDDEANILSALQRLFRPEGYRIFTAESGREGLEILERETVDLVISDMRMPEMNGAQFLEQVQAKWPDTVRVLLTGYAEISVTIDAINKGQIYRYISKPWEDADMILLVRQTLERRALEQEKKRLEALALKKGFLISIHVLSNLIELREGALAGHSRRVADLARKIAQRMGLSEAETQDVLVAGLLHNIGKIGLSDKILKKPFDALTTEERAEVVKHPVRAQAALMALEQLNEVGKIIRSHHERFDGRGYPDGLTGLAIPLGARILALVNDYYAQQIGSLATKRMNAEEASQFIKESRGKRYDPQVVDTFFGTVGVVEPLAESRWRDLQVSVEQLKPGMVLARNIMTRDGVRLLENGCLLRVDLIEQIRDFEKMDGHTLPIFIKSARS